ncbi:MAG: FAD-dependent oxidoreductase [Candidatus Thermoplasmatota archaeon]|nr:FAD-dependent oxidoreductase [Candidatus Thermoplasmatota archaeon]
MKLIVIGCGAAGATAAQFARKNDRRAEIKVFEGGKYPQYSKCALPYIISGETPPDFIIEFNEEWFRKAKIDLHLNTAVSSIDFNARIVKSSEGSEEYDALIIATGASPFSPVEPRGKTYFLRSLDDALAIRKEAKNSNKAVIIGAGLIGLEAAEALKKIGIDVTIVEFLPDILLTMVDNDIASIIRKKIEGKANMFFSRRVTEINESSQMEVIAVDKEGKENVFQGDFVIVATGNRPNIGLVESKADDVDKAITVNERCETSIENVYAVGDCTQYRDILGNDNVVGLGSVAVRQGMVAGANAVGGDEKMLPLVNARATKVFDVEMAAVGPLSRYIQSNSVTGKFKGSSLPEYLDGEDVFVKVCADENGKIIAAQAVGPEAAQRINKFSLAIHCGLTLEQFLHAETAYAPYLAPIIDTSTLACEIANRKVK